MVWPFCGLLMVGAVVTLAVNVVVNTFESAQFTVIAVALKVTATGVVWAFPVNVAAPSVGLVASTMLPDPVTF
jgi:hypothetical protein